MNSYSLYGIKSASTVIGGIRSQDVSPNIQNILEGGSGAVDPTLAAVMATSDRIMFDTIQIAQALGVAGFGGASVTTFLASFQQNTDFGERASTWLTASGYKALLVPRTLSVVQNGEAVLSMEAVLVGDASNQPLAFVTTSQSFSQVVSQIFTLGKVTLNGTAFEPQNLTIDFGLSVQVNSNSGTSYPLQAFIQRRQPTFQFTTLDLSKVTSLFSASIKGLTVTAFVAYLAKVAEGGGVRVADITAEHIKFSSTEGIAFAQQIQGSHGGEPPMSVTFTPAWDGSNAIVVLDTASAIT